MSGIMRAGGRGEGLSGEGGRERKKEEREGELGLDSDATSSLLCGRD